MIIFRWILVILTAIGFIAHLVKSLEEDNSGSNIVAVLIVLALRVYVIYWLVATIRLF